MSPYLVIAYATKNDYYETLSRNLQQSCKDFNIPLHLELIDSLGSWEKNTHYKAQFIKDAITKLDSPSFVYVDVDAVFRSNPILFDTIDCDISFRLENFPWRKDEPLSGTVYFKKSPEILSLIDEWIRINSETPAERRNPFTWEQFNMKKALDLHPELVFNNLPPEYVFITDHSRRLYPTVVPIIEHFQASRTTTR